jgi:hypothetical protein
MSEPQNIQISLTLFNNIIWFFECLCINDQKFPVLYGFDGILTDLRKKQNKINQRTAYTKAIYAEDEEQRAFARKNYCKLKQLKF